MVVRAVRGEFGDKGFGEDVDIIMVVAGDIFLEKLELIGGNRVYIRLSGEGNKIPGGIFGEDLG